MSVRTYNPSVRVGNWNEDIQLEEDTLKDFLERREKGELLIQQSANLLGSAFGKAALSVSRDGLVHFGDNAMLRNPGSRDGARGETALAVGMGSDDNATVTASTDVRPCARTSLVIVSSDGSGNGEALRYGQPFYLCTAGGGLHLQSDRATFQKSAKKSRHNAVNFVREASFLTAWKIVPFDPLFRLELDSSPVPANQKVIVTHVKTNLNLCLEENFLVRSPFGREYEISGYTKLDSHKAEVDINHWMIAMNVPGDVTMPMEAPTVDNKTTTGQPQTPLASS